MPYVDRASRKLIWTTDPNWDDVVLCPNEIDGPGKLNFAITALIRDYLPHADNLTYSAFNEVIGVLECAKLELYRRMVAPYEDEKKEENGDVYV